jgi:centromeric protein E
MKGYNSDHGLIPLSIQEIFTHINNINDRKFNVSVSYIEIYNESVNDLIDPQNKNLEIRESITQGIYINRLTENQVCSYEEVMAFMSKGDEARSIASTKLNEHSSRSHTVFRINIKSEG